LVIGLTGGIASGKSVVAERFAARGVPVLDTDVIARDVVAPGTPGLGSVREAFGDEVIDADGGLDRRELRRRIFADPALRERLENILHPLIRVELAARAAAAGGPYQIHVIPLLVEKGLRDRVDRVLLVDCSETTQAARLMARDGETTEGAQRILAAQSSRAERRAVADDILVNDGDLSGLDVAVARLDARYRQLAREAGDQARGTDRQAPVCRRSPADGQ
jgi:dephospho-CoA kinase